MERLPLAERVALDADRPQEAWYRLLAELARGLSVLDVGAGTGYGLDILAPAAQAVEGCDLLPAGPRVRVGAITDYPDASRDVVAAIDVIEHVGWADEDAAVFLGELLRVARRCVFFSTPNFARHDHGLRNPYHAREFSPAELRALLSRKWWRAWGAGIDKVPYPLPALTDDATAYNFGVLVDVA